MRANSCGVPLPCAWGTKGVLGRAIARAPSSATFFKIAPVGVTPCAAAQAEDKENAIPWSQMIASATKGSPTTGAPCLWAALSRAATKMARAVVAAEAATEGHTKKVTRAKVEVLAGRRASIERSLLVCTPSAAAASRKARASSVQHRMSGTSSAFASCWAKACRTWHSPHPLSAEGGAC